MTEKKLRKVRNSKIRVAEPDDPVYTGGTVIGTSKPGINKSPTSDKKPGKKKKNQARLPHQYPWTD